MRGSVTSHDPKNFKHGGHTACVSFYYHKKWFVLDAGTGIRNLGKKLAKTRRPIVLLLSHLHWDHVFGLPFFKPLYQRGRKIILAGPSRANHSFRKTLNEAMRPPFFPIRTNQWRARIRWQTLKQKPIPLDGVIVEPRRVAHHNGTFGFRFVFPDGRKIIYVTDQELRPADKKFARWIEGADLLIHDSQYDRKTYAKRKGWGHSCFEIVLTMAMDAKVKRLLLFHHDPDANDKTLGKRLLLCRQRIKARRSSLKCSMAKEGWSLVV
ncbi:MAG: MBL fold metallo-hydrolase [Deltaproteobacteria bacterium]|nr:MBL fold metallo-hydrolase [Deltaproteobacteria bacterium]